MAQENSKFKKFTAFILKLGDISLIWRFRSNFNGSPYLLTKFSALFYHRFLMASFQASSVSIHTWYFFYYVDVRTGILSGLPWWTSFFMPKQKNKNKKASFKKVSWNSHGVCLMTFKSPVMVKTRHRKICRWTKLLANFKVFFPLRISCFCCVCDGALFNDQGDTFVAQ